MSFAFSLLLTPFLMLLLAIVFLASIGKSLGVRRLYIKLLLALFEVSPHATLRPFARPRGPSAGTDRCDFSDGRPLRGDAHLGPLRPPAPVSRTWGFFVARARRGNANRITLREFGDEFHGRRAKGNYSLRETEPSLRGGGRPPVNDVGPSRGPADGCSESAGRGRSVGRGLTKRDRPFAPRMPLAASKYSSDERRIFITSFFLSTLRKPDLFLHREEIGAMGKCLVFRAPGCNVCLRVTAIRHLNDAIPHENKRVSYIYFFIFPWFLEM